jgi:hypothetical protein
VSEPHPELVRLRAAHRRVRRPDPELRERVARAVAADRRRDDARRWIGGGLVGAVMGVAALLAMHWVAVGLATRRADERMHDAAGYEVAQGDQPRATEPRGSVGRPGGPPPIPEPETTTAPATVLPQPSTPTTDVGSATASPTPAASKRAPSAGTPSAATLDLSAEVRLLREAEVALSTDPVHALALLRAHADRFPRTSLPLERRALRILALCATSPDDAAIRERDAFLREHPASPYAARVRAACE